MQYLHYITSMQCNAYNIFTIKFVVFNSQSTKEAIKQTSTYIQQYTDSCRILSKTPYSNKNNTTKYPAILR